MTQRTFFATCPKGLEYLLRDELVAIGADDVHEALAGVYFAGDLAIGYRACLWSRLASRILMPLADFAAPDENALYVGVRAIDWAAHLDNDSTLAVDSISNSSAMRHTRYLSQKVKDAIVDQFRDLTGERPGVDTEHPSIRLNLLLRKDHALLSLDLSGTPLHRRGYRIGQGEAPLKENLACALLLRAGWPEVAARGGAIVDPMCGAGTLLIEAALMAADVAPGLKREYFGFLRWRGHQQLAWDELLADSRQRADAGLRQLPRAFFGYDADPKVLAEARRNAQSAGLAGFIEFGRQSVEHLKKPAGCDAPGLLICNPPYGERIGQQDELVSLYRALGTQARAEFDGWRMAVMTSDMQLGHAVGLRSHKQYALYNGALECKLLLFDITGEAVPREAVERPLSAGSEAVANRIRKTVRHLRKRVQREEIDCWRVYDADLPEYAAAIDIYTGVREHVPDESPQSWLHVQEYAAPKDIPENVARARFGELLRGAKAALEVPRERIATKIRTRSKGGSSYGQFDARGEFLLVGEGGLRFRVNLHDYLDTGLFLDHRPLRARIRELARGKRFLNLFCYTGSVSAYAASGGAAATTSVDLSATYLDWAGRNLQLNGCSGANHRLVQADSMQWLAHERGEYDLIYVDPPTFSNSKRADDFDVQRDHVRLLQLCAERLSAGGLIVFSNNNRRFRIDSEALSGLEIRDMSSASIPFDFARNPRIHRCYEMNRL